ncbi:MAG: hypothetical protein AB8H79_06070 [Myxococcota bacterium]
MTPKLLKTQFLDIVSTWREDKRNPMFYAAWVGLDLFQPYLDRRDITRRDDAGHTVLHAAGNFRVVAAIMKKHPELLQETNHQGQTAFHLWAMSMWSGHRTGSHLADMFFATRPRDRRTEANPVHEWPDHQGWRPMDWAFAFDASRAALEGERVKPPKRPLAIPTEPKTVRPPLAPLDPVRPYQNPDRSRSPRVKSSIYLAAKSGGGSVVTDAITEDLVDAFGLEGGAMGIDLVAAEAHGRYGRSAAFQSLHREVKKVALHSLALATSPTRASHALDQSRLGGPAVQVSSESASSLPHVGQLALESLAPHQDYLPRTGLIQCFAEVHPDGNVRGKLDYYDTFDPEQLTLSVALGLFEHAHEVRATPCAAMPYMLDDEWLYLRRQCGILSEIEPMAADQGGFGLRHGAPKDAPHTLNGYVPGPAQTDAAKQFGGTPHDWVLLWVVDLHAMGRVDGPQFLWVAVHRSDLTEARFNQAVFGTSEGVESDEGCG